MFLLSLTYYGYAAFNFPVLFNVDNNVNYEATSYIAKHHKIPVVAAEDKEIYFTQIGTTRSLRPPFTFIVSAIVADQAEHWVDDRKTRLRLGSPLIGALTVVIVFLGFYLAFSHLGLALLGAGLIALLPKFVFLASCNNDDIGAILSASLLFSSVLALHRFGDKAWVFVALAASFGLVLQTKYTAWLILPWLGLYTLFLLREQWRKVVRWIPILLVIGIAAGGWWVVFNMLNYGVGDPSALRHAAELQRTLGDDVPNQRGYASQEVGVFDMLSNHDQFLTRSYKSLIGYLEWIDLEVGVAAYLFYAMVFLLGIIAAVCRSKVSHTRTNYLDVLILLIIISQCLFYLHHNFIRDTQPQARYLLPVIMPMIYLFLSMLSRISVSAFMVKIPGREFGFQTVSASALIMVCVFLYAFTFSYYIKPSYAAKPFYTSLKNPRNIDLDRDIEIVSTSSLRYSKSAGRLELLRDGEGRPSLFLGADFCQLLPLNALISVSLSSPTKGGLYLRIDRDNQETYDSLYWRSFPAGKSTGIFSINSQNCSGAKITLARKAHRVVLENLQVSDLRIHQYGKPL